MGCIIRPPKGRREGEAYEYESIQPMEAYMSTAGHSNQTHMQNTYSMIINHTSTPLLTTHRYIRATASCRGHIYERSLRAMTNPND